MSTPQTSNQTQTPSEKEIKEYAYNYVVINEDLIVLEYIKEKKENDDINYRLEQVAETISAIKNAGPDSLTIISVRDGLYGYRLDELKLVMHEYDSMVDHELARLYLVTPSGAKTVQLNIWLNQLRYQKEVYEGKQKIIEKWKNLIKLAKELDK
jgi:hypothetical protein|uniref:Uncharacterized protein n=1 Tax=Candidatus Aramenus sulfurataquae TaxID=1326980 RepID=A0A0F2LPA9_9CREN|nr:hypothetical protein [Candidatus Aramenus sulfurataquae]